MFQILNFIHFRKQGRRFRKVGTFLEAQNFLAIPVDSFSIYPFFLQESKVFCFSSRSQDAVFLCTWTVWFTCSVFFYSDPLPFLVLPSNINTFYNTNIMFLDIIHSPFFVRKHLSVYITKRNIWRLESKNYNSVQCRLSGKICFSCVGTIRRISSLQWWFLSWQFSGARPHTCRVFNILTFS
jgi:hypothetical protein